MENIEKNLPATPSTEESFEREYDVFIQEINGKKAEEMAKKKRGEKYDPHWEDIKSEYLGPQEQGVYAQFKAGELTVEEFEKRRDEAMQELDELYRQGKSENDYSKSKLNFWGYLGNEIATREGEKIMEQLKKEQEARESQKK